MASRPRPKKRIMPKVLLLGTGNMGKALLSGMIESKRFTQNDICVFDPNAAAAQEAGGKWGVGVAASAASGLAGAQIVLLAMKPVDLAQALRTIAPELNDSHMIVSIAAGVTTKRIGELAGAGRRIVRAMPNTPGLIGAGITAIAVDDVSNKDLESAEQLFRCIGEVVRVPENLMDAVTGLSGSGPAYVFLFMESLIEGGVKAGLSADIASKLALQTVMGAAKLALQSNEDLATLRRRVTSPGGTTMAGCKVLDDNGFRAVLISAVEAATARSRELSKSA